MRKCLLAFGIIVSLTGCVATSALDDNQLCYYIGNSAYQGKTWAVDTALSELKARQTAGTLTTNMQQCKKYIMLGQSGAAIGKTTIDSILED